MIGSVISKNGINIRLTAERWAHIVESHDYMAGNQEIVFETLEDPDIILGGEKDEFIAVKHYTKTALTEKHVIVIYKEEINDGFVITVFMTSKPEKITKKRIIWKK